MSQPYTIGGDKMMYLCAEGKMASTAGHRLAKEILAEPPTNPMELVEVIGLLKQVLRENMQLWDAAEMIRAADSRRGRAARLREERKRGE